jgi:hypothetical protein
MKSAVRAASNVAIRTGVTGDLQDLQEWNLCHVFSDQ